MKRVTAVIIALAAGVAVTAAAIAVRNNQTTEAENTAGEAMEAEQEDESWAKALNDGYITIGVDPDFMPMCHQTEDGEWEGFDIDIMNEAAKRMGVKAEYKAVEWEDMASALSGGEIDLIMGGMRITPTRMGVYLVSDSYINGGEAFVVRNDAGIVNQEDLEDKNIAVADGTHGDNINRMQGRVTADDVLAAGRVEAYSEISDLFDALDSGEADAVLMDEMTARWYINNKNIGDTYTVMADEYQSCEIAAAGRASDTALITELNKAFSLCREEGITTFYSEQWFANNFVD